MEKIKEFTQISDIIVNSGGVACGESLSVEAYRDDNKLYFKFLSNACTVATNVAKYLETELSGCDEDKIIGEVKRLLQYDFKRTEKWIFNYLPERERCVFAPIEVLQTILLGNHLSQCNLEDNKLLACDACVRVRTLNWGKTTHSRKILKLRDFASELSNLEKEGYDYFQKMGLCVQNDLSLFKRLASVDQNDFSVIKQLRLAAPYYNNARRYNLAIDDKIKGLAVKQQISLLVAKHEIDVVEKYIEEHALNVGLVKGGKTSIFYPKGDIRPHMDFDYLATNFKDAFQLISYLLNKRNFKLVVGGSVPISLKCVDGGGGQEELTGHIHLEKILQDRYQIVIDINMGAFPMGRTGVIKIKNARDITLEEITCITTAHLFKHENAFMKDINDLYYILKSGQIKYDVLKENLIRYGLQNYWGVAIHFMNVHMGCKDSFDIKMSPFISYLGKRNWPFSAKAHFFVKMADLIHQSCKKYGIFRGAQEAWRQISGASGKLPTKKYHSLIGEMNTRAYLYPIVIFTSCVTIPHIEGSISLKDEMYVYKNIIILPIGLFLLQHKEHNRKDLNEDVQFLLRKMGINEGDCNASYIMEARKNIWLY